MFENMFCGFGRRGGLFCPVDGLAGSQADSAFKAGRRTS